jgi:ankyrin repeat protein
VADVNVTDEYAWTPLHLASKLGNTGTVKALLASGAKVNGMTMLTYDMQ